MTPSPVTRSDSPFADRLVATLDGPSKTITVEPIHTPAPAPRVLPEQPPSVEPPRPREPAH
jgi:hypothetical protein